MPDAISGLHEFGPYRLETAKRLITRRGDPVPLAPKTFDLLLLLIGGEGRLLTKDELMKSLWPDTYVEEANLKFQISILRKALGQPAAEWIETVPKLGYRLCLPGSTAPPHWSRPHWDRLKWAAAGTLTVVVVVLAIFILRRVGEPPPVTNVAPLTAYPGLELHPSLSPDGTQVAFCWNGPGGDNFDIYVKLVGPGEPARITSDPAPDFSPAWSPDGHRIAFLRGPVGGMLGVHIIPALGRAAERRIIGIRQPHANHPNRILMPNVNLAWTPDGKSLVIAGQLGPGERTALWLVATENGQPRRLTDPPEGILGDYGPAVAPNGRMLAFVRVRDMAVNELTVIPLAPDYSPAGPPRRLPPDGLSMETPAWMADSQRIIVSAGPALGVRRLFLIEADQRSNQAKALGNGEDGTALSVARSGRMVYSRQLRDTGVWELDLGRAGAAPKRLISSTRDDYTPHYSPDGTKIAFGSTRSGFDEVWIADADGSNPKQVSDFGGTQTGNPRWAPDGTTIVLNSRRGGASRLYVMDVATGHLRDLGKNEQGIEPRWSRDGKWIYFVSNRTGGNEVWKMPAGGGKGIRVTRNGGSSAEESPDGSILYFSKGSSLWRVPVAGGDEVQVADGMSYQSNFAVADHGVYFLAEGRPRRTARIRFHEFSTGQTTELLDTGQQPWIGLAIARNGQKLLYSVVDSWESDLMFRDGFK